jgi:plastocyanin
MRPRVRTRFVTFLAALALAGCADQGPPRPAPAEHRIAIDNFTFNPPDLTVAVGDSVTWVNHDDVPHTATSSAQPRAFDSGALDTDGTFTHVFTAPGTYAYFCAVHKHMTGRVIVK